MESFAEEWKKAKTLFETATNKKKPTEKVLGIFRKGTGIGEAAKGLDAAKTPEEKKKAFATFKSSYTSYIDLLNKTANDPKSIKPEDKSAYISAIISLKLALEGIEKVVVQRFATTSSGNKEVTEPKVDVKKQPQEELIKLAKQHIALREKVLKDATDLSNKMKSTIQTFNERIGLVEKQVLAAQQAAAKSNLNGQKVAVATIDKFIQEAEGILEKARAAVHGFTEGGSDFMKARSDMGNIYGAINEPLGSQLKTASNKPWGPVGQMSADAITQVKTLETLLQKMHSARAEALKHVSEGRSVKDYLTDALTLKATMESLIKDMRLKSDRITKSVEEFEQKVKLAGTNKVALLKHCTLVEDQWKRYKPEVIALRDRLGIMKDQAGHLPPAALEDKAIAKAVADAGKAADDGISVFNKQLEDGKQLELKVAGVRQNNN